MPYEPGSYLQELEEEHAQGNHKNREDANCPTCREDSDEALARSDGFRSAEEYENASWDAIQETAAELEEDLDAIRREEHGQGKHQKYPDRNCLVCIREHGINNI
jgi:hypothetical protein